MNCFTLTYVLQKPEDSSEQRALPLQGLSFGGGWFAEGGMSPSTWPHGTPRPLGWPSSIPWPGSGKGHIKPMAPQRGQPPSHPWALWDSRMPKPCRDGSVPTSPNLSADECQDPCPGALCSTRTVVPGPQRGIRVPRTTLRHLQGLQHKRCYPLKLTHCVSSPVEKALATHCRSSGLKGTRTRWTPGLRSTALSGYMK